MRKILITYLLILPITIQTMASYVLEKATQPCILCKGEIFSCKNPTIMQFHQELSHKKCVVCNQYFENCMKHYAEKHYVFIKNIARE